MNFHNFYYSQFPVRRCLQVPIPNKDFGFDYPYTRLPTRRCLLEPTPAIYLAHDLLNEAAECHKKGDHEGAEKAIQSADLPEISEWMESIWGPFSPSIHRRWIEKIADEDKVPPATRAKQYIPKELRDKLVERDGYHCRWCGIPVISAKARDLLKKKYPKIFRWGPANADKHAAFQAMILSEDHVIPRSRGGQNLMDNLIVSCSPCNSGRGDFLPQEMCLTPPVPQQGPWITSDWDGLIRILPKKRK